MAVPPIQIHIYFKSVLESLANCLGYPKPSYYFSEPGTNCISVCMRTGTEPHAYVYEGDTTTTVEKSTESAAQKAVLDLMKRANVYIEDVSSLAQQEIERCVGLYKLKRVELQRIENGLDKITMYENLLISTSNYATVLSVDFVSILDKVLKRFEIPCTPVEIIELGIGSYIAWFTVLAITNTRFCKTIFSSRKPSREIVRQNLAFKVLEYLKPLYNFEVVDANYNPEAAGHNALLCSIARESYITTKERVLGIKAEAAPLFHLMEADCITPKAASYEILSDIP